MLCIACRAVDREFACAVVFHSLEPAYISGRYGLLAYILADVT